MARYPGNAAFVEARNYTRVIGANLPVRRIVIHDMEWLEGPTTAEACAAMFHSAGSPRASCHFMVDSNSVVQGVDLDRIAWHAPPNTGSIGIEHSGFARQTQAQWLDAYGKDMIWHSTALVAWLCTTLDIPPRWLSIKELRLGRRGLCTHADVAMAWRKTDHTDPGPGFPRAYYLSQVLLHLAGSPDPRGGIMSATVPTLNEIQSGILFYPLDSSHVNPLTMLTRTYDAVNRQATVLEAIRQAEAAEEEVDVQALAAAIVAELPQVVVENITPAELATAVADELARRLHE